MVRSSSLPGWPTFFPVPCPRASCTRPTPRPKSTWSKWGTSPKLWTVLIGMENQTFRTRRSADSTRETPTTSRLSGDPALWTGTLTVSSWSIMLRRCPAPPLHLCSICGAQIHLSLEARPPRDQPGTCTSAASNTRHSAMSSRYKPRGGGAGFRSRSYPAADTQPPGNSGRKM